MLRPWVLVNAFAGQPDRPGRLRLRGPPALLARPEPALTVVNTCATLTPTLSLDGALGRLRPPAIPAWSRAHAAVPG